MTVDEKLENLEKIEKKLNKLQKKAYILIGELNSTEEYSSASSTDYAERDLQGFVKWMRWETDRQRKWVLKYTEE